MKVSEYCGYDGVGLAELIRRKEVTSTEVLNAALEAVSKANPTINAVLQTLPNAARKLIKAGIPQGPLSGVPTVIKELVIHAAGVRCDMGSRLAQGFTPRTDTELMARMRRAGLVLIGTTQTPELGYNPTTECVLHGPVRNPWDLARSAGGSSGGAGAAVASGMVPLAQASDGGGSIRIPAACNGLVGLKPSRDRIPSGPDYGDLLCGWATEFAITKSVRDAAVMLDAVAGPDVGAPHFIAPPARPYVKELKARPRKLRIAWTTVPASGAKIDPECKRAVEQTIKVARELGHTVIERAPRYDWQQFLEATHIVWATFTAQFVMALSQVMQRKADRSTLEAVTLACHEDGKRRSATELLDALAHGNTLTRMLGEFFTDIDVFITPTTAKPAPVLGEINQNRRGLSALDWTAQVFNYVPFTPLLNTTGNPAMSLPLHWTASGLPVGVQIVGRHNDEATLIGLAAQLERAMPWHKRRAPNHAASL